MNINELNNLFGSTDIIYHYTSLKNSKLILYENKLLLSQRTKSIDPFENTFPNIIFSNIYDKENALVKDGIELKKEILNSYSNIKQICFCKNKNEFFPLSLNNYGFMKSRMWDQYADKYKGVCLAFSKSELLKENNCKPEFYEDVKYIDYDNFDSIDSGYSINMNTLYEKGIEYYKDLVINGLQFRRSCFIKSKDYEGENEFRIIDVSENCCPTLSINNSLKAIIVSSTDECESKGFDSLAEQYNCELVFVKFGGTIRFESLTEKKNMIKLIRDCLNDDQE